MKTRCVVLGLLLVAFDGGTLADTPASELYVRDARTIPETVRAVKERTVKRGSAAVLFAFDSPTFAPPARAIFAFDHDYAADTRAWLDALGAWAADAGAPPLFVTATLARDTGGPVRAGLPDWRRIAESALADRRWMAGQIEPAATWMARLREALPESPVTLVLVTGDMLPERSAEAGEYWDEEAVGRQLSSTGAVLEIVAPEARFGDFTPVGEIPEVPFASRPAARGSAPPEIETPPGTQEAMPQAILDRAARGAGSRFSSDTPLWFPRFAGRTFFNTACPSGFGYWPFARAAALTGGGYCFYPLSPSASLDACPFDPALLAQLAPELAPRRECLAARLADPAMDALGRAARLVLDAAPWEDALPRRATSWLAVEPGTPSRPAERFEQRNKPRDTLVSGTLPELVDLGKRLAGAPPRCDEAFALLTEALARFTSGTAPATSRRSLANLRLARFWFAMGAFHIEALSLYLRDLPSAVTPGAAGKGERFAITHLSTIRLSDCLEAYDGRLLAPEEDDEIAASGAARRPAGWQGNILPIPAFDPRYRALRDPHRVLEFLDPRLVPRALRMIAAAEDVMAHEGRSPFGWMVYYSEAKTFAVTSAAEGPLTVERELDPDRVGKPRLEDPGRPVIR